MARQGQALRGRPARFIGTITVGGGEVPAAGKHSKDDVNSPEREFREQLRSKGFKRIENSDN